MALRTTSLLRFSVTAILGAALAVAGTMPQDAAADGTPPGLSHIEKKGVRLTEAGTAHGMSAWIGRTRDGGSQVFYVTPDGGAVIAGLMVDASGALLLARELSDAAGRASASEVSSDATSPAGGAGASDAASPAGLTWFSIGRAEAPAMFMFADASCPFCALSIKDLMPFIQRGAVQVRVVPIAVLRRESVLHAAAALQSGDPGKEWLDHAGKGASSPPQMSASEVTQETLWKIEDNNQAFRGLLHQGVAVGTPHFVFRGTDGGIRHLKGRPANAYNDLVSQVAPATVARGEFQNRDKGGASNGTDQ